MRVVKSEKKPIKFYFNLGLLNILINQIDNSNRKWSSLKVILISTNCISNDKKDV